MERYIDKSALVAEIKRKKEEEVNYDDDGKSFASYADYIYYSVLDSIQDFIDTLEVKEVDLEKEIENILEKEKAFVTDNREVKYYNGDSFNHIYELEFIAKHFFELGLKTQKGE